MNINGLPIEWRQARPCGGQNVPGVLGRACRAGR